MAVKNYLINDKWLDIDKQNIVEVKSTDGVIGSVKVNGEEYGGSGGGGGSDFSTAEVTVSGPLAGYGSNVVDDGEYQGSWGDFHIEESGTVHVILYKGKAFVYTADPLSPRYVSVLGNIETIADGIDPTMISGFLITGDCTITMS